MRDFDLNLVRTFVLLYETRSVTATAESLHVTQPTISYSLQKLRRRFSDELFRRTGGGLVPTTTARALYEPLHSALSEIETAVSGAWSFDPSTARAAFTLCLSDLGEISLLPRLMAALPGRAPGVTLTVRPLDVDRAVKRAVTAGAQITMPVSDQFWGARYGRIRDPFGHVWAFNAPLAKVS